jgi:hypothetical protein
MGPCLIQIAANPATPVEQFLSFINHTHMISLYQLRKQTLLSALLWMGFTTVTMSVSAQPLDPSSQQLKRSNVPAPAFEVTGSIYPWEMRDEGIDLVLDNMTGIAGINSVYLLAVMHKEHRPFNSENLPGEYTFIHNPIRHEWDAEDSRVYFHPHAEMYGRIKPLFSDTAWLRETDWLKIMLEKAHARGLRAGAEVSHTYIPLEYLNANPDLQQRDINNKTTGRPCTNNPDVMAYLLALYGDIASNYDVDYIQTCMLLFSNSDDPTKGGTCFCESCRKAAKEAGFDLDAAIPILRDNPYAEPQRDQWLEFRRTSTVKAYKLVTDRIHQANPKIDFRLNDLNNRSSGLHVEDLKNNINSIHLSTHTEQKGYQNTDRASRIATSHYYAGPDIPILPGVPTRLLSTPAIVKSSIKINVEGGAKGLGVKHYDGSPYCMLRAVRDGLAEAGVSGFTPTLGVEAEAMTLSGYTPDTWLQEKGVHVSGTGTATTSFIYPSGVYDVATSYSDEKNGQSTFTLFVGGKKRGTWTSSEDVDCWRRKTLPKIRINKGEEIKLVGVANGSESARIDFIEFIPQTPSGNAKK